MNEPEFAALVGIDWADRQHETCLFDVASQALEASTLNHKPAELRAWINQLRQRFGGRPVAIAVEQKRGGLVHALMEHDFIVIYPINPATAARFRRAWAPSRAKTDPGDAALLLELIRVHRDRLDPLKPQDAKTREITLLNEHRRKAVNLRVRLVNQLKSALKAYYPLAIEVAGEDLASPLALAFLKKWPSFAPLKRARAATLRKFYYQKNCRFPRTIERRITAIEAAETLTEDSVLTEVYSLQVKGLVEQIGCVQGHIVRYEKRLNEVMREHDNREILASFPGVGKVFLPRLAAAFGTDKTRYKDAEELVCYAGIAPVVERSGQSEWIHRRWTSPAFLKQTFHEYAGESIRHSLWARAFYIKKREAGKRHHAAVRALAYKWMRIMFRCWKEGTTYDEVRYLKSLKDRGSDLLKIIAEHDLSGEIRC